MLWKITIEGMTCGGCSGSVRKALLKIPGVHNCTVSHADKLASIEADDSVSRQVLINCVIDTGFDVVGKPQRQSPWRWIWRALLSGLAGVLLLTLGLIGILPSLYTPLGQIIGGVISALTFFLVLYAGGESFRECWREIKRRRPGMHSLISLAVGSGWIYSTVIVAVPHLFPVVTLYFSAVLMVLAFFNLGEAIKHRVYAHIDQESKAAEAPYFSLLKASISKGEEFQVEDNALIPTDAILLSERGAIEQAAVNGEAWPVHLSKKAPVQAGMRNVSGATLRFEATENASESSLATMQQRLRATDSNELKERQLADRVAGWLVPVAILAAMIAAVVWGVLNPALAIPVFASMLVAVCPCIFGLVSLPEQVLRHSSLKAGILLKSPSILSDYAKVMRSQKRLIVFDKTGTLTEAKFKVTSFDLEDDDQRQTCLAAILALETNIKHLFADALMSWVMAQEDKPSEILTCDDRQQLSNGVSGTINGEQWQLGDASLLADAPTDDTDGMQKKLYLLCDGKLKATLTVETPLREGAEAMMKQLRKKGFELAILSGDNETRTQAIAKQLGIQQWFASERDKAKKLEELRQTYSSIIAVGDGHNDLEMLKKADIGIAMGNHAEVAAAGDIHLGSKLRDLPALLQSFDRAKRCLHRNLWGIVVYSSINLLFASGAFYSLLGAINPAVFAAVMAVAAFLILVHAMVQARQTQKNFDLPASPTLYQRWKTQPTAVKGLTVLITVSALLAAIGTIGCPMLGMNMSAMVTSLFTLKSAVMCACCASFLLGYAGLVIALLLLVGLSVHRYRQKNMKRETLEKSPVSMDLHSTGSHDSPPHRAAVPAKEGFKNVAAGNVPGSSASQGFKLG